MAYALHSLSFISHAGGDWELSVAQIDRALAVTADEPGLADLHLLLLGNRAAGAEGLGRLGESLQWLRQARELAERTGTPRLAMIRLKAAEVAFDGGRWDEATAELDAITELPDQVGHPLHQGGMLALIAVRRGDSDQAERQLAALKDQVVVPSVASEAIYLIAARALAEERADRPQQAVAVLAPLVTQEYGENLPSRSEWLPGLVRLALAADDRPTAEQAADAARRDAEQLPLPLKLASAQWCRGLLDGDPAAVLRSVEFLRSAELRMHLGNALEDAAALQAAAGEPDAARETLAEAVAVYSERDALWEARRATARLRALGVRLGVRGPRQRPRTGWAALTAAETGVAELVARGQANPEIAAQLKLSRRTVESHVSHILEKLRIRSRRDVAELAAAHSGAAATAPRPQ
jgi:ATP/maltotriose-dependent transcriptional regulator MalT